MVRYLFIGAFVCAGLSFSLGVEGQDKTEKKEKTEKAASEKTEKPATDKAADKAAASIWGHIEIKGAYPEATALPGLFGELSESLHDALARFDKAATDDTLQGLILHVNSPHIGWAKLNEFRTAIAKVRKAGKKVFAYFDDGSSMDYLIAASCDEVCMPESGVLMFLGLRAEVSFYKNLFDKLDLKAEMLRVGEYKSAAEPYSRSEMSKEFREEMESVLDSYFSQMKAIVGDARKLTPEQVEAAINAGPFTAVKAKELGMIDRLVYPDELEALVKGDTDKKVKITRKYGKKKLDTDFSGFSGMVKMMDLIMGIETPKRKTTTPKLAVINAIGPIMTGHSSSDMFSGESTIGAETLNKAIRQANEDDSVKAIVLRVDSPGGSALASDLMWRELERVKKPLVVSMGDVAASGGYYISMNAKKIYAEPGTITGSIGVVGGKLATQGLFDKIGINTSIITRGKNAGVMSVTTPFSDTERAAMQALMNDIYKQFTEKAAKGRRMDVVKLEKLARGRIYTGLQAKELGLVDEIGTLADAIAEAKKLAGLDPSDKLEKLELPKPTSPFETLFGSLDPNARIQAANNQWLQSVLGELSPELKQHLGNLTIFTRLAKEPRLVLMPFQIRVK
ncbi:MAG: signal peptide peptidase SppA, type [Planctomycetaceae bacterium]|nr:signal peptide peptidase SppA, type [Planctomycetaceae bacterium]